MDPRAWGLLAALGVVVFAMVGSAHHQEVPSASRLREYTADVPKTILELQQFRQSHSIRIRSTAGREGVATLINLNPSINAQGTHKMLQAAELTAEEVMALIAQRRGSTSGTCSTPRGIIGRSRASQKRRRR